PLPARTLPSTLLPPTTLSRPEHSTSPLTRPRPRHHYTLHLRIDRSRTIPVLSHRGEQQPLSHRHDRSLRDSPRLRDPFHSLKPYSSSRIIEDIHDHSRSPRTLLRNSQPSTILEHASHPDIA